MTAPALTATRADLIDDLNEAARLLRDTARSLDFAQYPDTSKLGSDRAKLRHCAEWAGEVMGSLALLGTDPEARD